MAEKLMDAFSGAREICIFVPFLLYNCTGFPLSILDLTNQMKEETMCSVPSCYDLGEHEHLLGGKDGLGFLLSNQEPRDMTNSFTYNHIVSFRQNSNPQSRKFLSNPQKSESQGQKASLNSMESLKLDAGVSRFVENETVKAKPCMYSPNPSSFSVSETTVKVRRSLPESLIENNANNSWSSPFFLVPTSGSTTVLVPQLSSIGAFVVSVTANPFSGRTRAITFQPRYNSHTKIQVTSTTLLILS